MPTVTGVLETSLYVQDIESSKRFYQTLFGFEVLAEDSRFCALNVSGRQVLLLFRKGAPVEPSVLPGGTIPAHGGSGHLHLAFSIAVADWQDWERWLHAKQVPIESRVTWPAGGQSLYFRDPDHHLIELATPGIWSIY
jgi:catechol 2,3-dioxygenase-like lactoylglutathione lyase family enzyme